jgi:hypothetical protein
VDSSFFHDLRNDLEFRESFFGFLLWDGNRVALFVKFRLGDRHISIFSRGVVENIVSNA